jgi:hypothetical protein
LAVELLLRTTWLPQAQDTAVVAVSRLDIALQSVHEVVFLKNQACQLAIGPEQRVTAGPEYSM